MISHSHVLFLGEQWYCVSLKSNCCCCCSVAKSCPTVCDLMDSSPAGSSLHGVLQARVLEWAAIPSPGDLPDPGITLRPPALRADSLPSQPPLLLLLLRRSSRVRLCATPQTAAHQAPPSLGVSRQEHWSGVPFPPPMHESERWKWSCSVMSDSSDPMDCSPPGSSVHGIAEILPSSLAFSRWI